MTFENGLCIINTRSGFTSILYVTGNSLSSTKKLKYLKIWSMQVYLKIIWINSLLKEKNGVSMLGESLCI